MSCHLCWFQRHNRSQCLTSPKRGNLSLGVALLALSLRNKLPEAHEIIDLFKKARLTSVGISFMLAQLFDNLWNPSPILSTLTAYPH